MASPGLTSPVETPVEQNTLKETLTLRPSALSNPVASPSTEAAAPSAQQLRPMPIRTCDTGSGSTRPGHQVPMQRPTSYQTHNTQTGQPPSQQTQNTQPGQKISKWQIVYQRQAQTILDVLKQRAIAQYGGQVPPAVMQKLKECAAARGKQIVAVYRNQELFAQQQQMLAEQQAAYRNQEMLARQQQTLAEQQAACRNQEILAQQQQTLAEQQTKQLGAHVVGTNRMVAFAESSMNHKLRRKKLLAKSGSSGDDKL